MGLIDRFQAKVKKTESCWEWQATTNGKYGILRDETGTYRLAHRISYRLFKGPIPENSVVMHTCDNPLCVNPEHLVPGTQKDNMEDMLQKDRGTLRKLTREQVAEIRRLGATTDMLHRTIAKQFGVHRTVVSRILRNEIYLV